jgi:hypothetical protein
MPEPKRPSARREDGAPSNWDRYIELLGRRRVPENMQRWYVLRVEEFLKATQSRPLSQLTKDEVAGYFARVSSENRLADWQFRQLVEAMQLLLVDLAQVSAAKEVDWDYWKEAGKELNPNHPTIAKELAPGLPAQRNVDGPRFARSAAAFPVLERLARTIRAMRYSIRTEQSYMDWCRRFLAFCAPAPEEQLGAADVQRFLTHLAVDRSVAAGSTCFPAAGCHRIRSRGRCAAIICTSPPCSGRSSRPRKGPLSPSG